MRHTAWRFFRIEQEAMEHELLRMDMGSNVSTLDGLPDERMLALYDEMLRRAAILETLLAGVEQYFSALDAVDSLVAELNALRDARLAAGATHADLTDLEIDMEYVAGLRERLARAIAEETVVYALADVERL